MFDVQSVYCSGQEEFHTSYMRPRETEVLDENVRHTFEDENEYDDEDEKENDDEGGSCRAVSQRAKAAHLTSVICLLSSVL